ncbi:MAG: RMD1 family protein [Rhodoblastus sp.]
MDRAARLPLRRERTGCALSLRRRRARRADGGRGGRNPASLKSRVAEQPDSAVDEDEIVVNVDAGDDKVSSGVVNVQKFGDERFIVVADTLAKSVALARNERSVNAVFEAVEPFAADMASAGRTPSDRKAVLKLVGEAILLSTA